MTNRPLTYGQIFSFWAPLALMWFLMGVELPAVNAAVARLPDATINLAAFGLTFSLGIIIQSPMVQLLAASTALAGNRSSYRLLLKFTIIGGLVLTAMHLLVWITPLFEIITADLFDVPDEIIRPARLGFALTLPWGLGVGLRRLWQGLLIKHGKTNVVMIGMMGRVIALAILLVVGITVGTMSGILLAALAYMFAVWAAAIVTYITARPLIKTLSSEKAQIPLTMKKLLRFYYPLAISSFVTLAARPILTAGIARSPEPLESLAAWPVLWSYMFLFTSVAISYQEVVIALYSNEQDGRSIRRFSCIVALSLSALFFITTITPISAFWYKSVIRVPTELLRFLTLPTRILALTPILATFVSLLRGIQVVRNRTSEISKAVLVNLVVLTSVVFAFAYFLPLPGAIGAATAMIAATGAELIFLLVRGGIRPLR